MALIQLPVYMVHQAEEHFHDRFRRDVNNKFAHGGTHSIGDLFCLSNVVGIWVVDVALLYLTRFIGPGLSLIAAYLALVNATIHVVLAVATRPTIQGSSARCCFSFPLGWLACGLQSALTKPLCPISSGVLRSQCSFTF